MINELIKHLLIAKSASKLGNIVSTPTLTYYYFFLIKIQIIRRRIKKVRSMILINIKMNQIQ